MAVENWHVGWFFCKLLSTLRIAWQLGVWFHRTFSDPEFRSGPFQPPQPPADESEEPGGQR